MELEARKSGKTQHGTVASITVKTDRLEVPISSLRVKQRGEKKLIGRQNKEKKK